MRMLRLREHSRVLYASGARLAQTETECRHRDNEGVFSHDSICEANSPLYESAPQCYNSGRIKKEWKTLTEREHSRWKSGM